VNHDHCCSQMQDKGQFILHQGHSINNTQKWSRQTMRLGGDILIDNSELKDTSRKQVVSGL
jgi:hypothetical protein